MVRLTRHFKDAQHTLSFALVLGYFGLLRVSNYLVYSEKLFDPSKHLMPSDIQIISGRVVVTLKWSKTRQNAEKTYVVLPTISNNVLSPVKLYNNLVQATALVMKQDRPLMLLPSGTPLTVNFFNRALKWLALQVLGCSTGVGSHMLRRSGTTFMARAGATDLQLMNHGTCTSDCFRT